MKRQCLQRKLFSGFIFLCISLSFSISTFSAAFTGAYMTTETDPVTGQVTTVIKDVNPSSQTFSGQNVVEMNAYNNAPVLTNNTFNGSTDINPDFTSITSSGNAYNGSVDINYDGLGGTLDSNGDRFQSTTVTAQQSDISISNGTFNGSTTINAQSVSLGSISQMDSLLNGLFIFMNGLTQARTGSTNYVDVTNDWNGQTVRIRLNTISGQKLVYDSTNHTITSSNVTAPWPYGNFHARIVFLQQCNIDSLSSLGTFLSYWFGYFVTNVLDNSATYRMYQFAKNGEHYTFSSNQTTTSFRSALLNRFDCMVQLIEYYCDKFYNWYYPLDNVLPEYWRYYNTDTAQQEEIGLAGLMYNISWYLGQMYVLQSASQSLDNMTDQVEAITDTLEEAEQKENAVISSISSGINSFAPDLTEIGAFRALSWTSNYLQQMFVALGTYGTVILVGLLLGVCMQFIGYFKYK